MRHFSVIFDLFSVPIHNQNTESQKNPKKQKSPLLDFLELGHIFGKLCRLPVGRYCISYKDFLCGRKDTWYSYERNLTFFYAFFYAKGAVVIVIVFIYSPILAFESHAAAQAKTYG